MPERLKTSLPKGGSQKSTGKTGYIFGWMLLLLACGIFAAGAPSFAVETDPEVDGTVIAGSEGNRISIAIANPSPEVPIADADLAVSKPGRWIDNIRIEKDTYGPIPPGGVRRFTLFFDILPEAEHGAVDKLTLQVAVRGALVDHPNPFISVRIENPAQTEKKCAIDHEHAIPGWTGEEKHFVYIFRHHQSAEILRVLVYSGPADGTFSIALQSRHDEKLGPFSALGHAMHKAEQYCDSSLEPLGESGAPPRLRLVGIDYRGETGGPSQLGASVQQRRILSQAEYDEILSVDLEAPSEIIAGEPILISSSAMRSVQYDEGSFCYPGEPEPDSHSSRITLKVGPEEVTARGADGLANYCLGNVKDESHSRTASSWYSYTNSFTGHSRATLTLSPTGVERMERHNRPDEVLYRYQVKATGRAELLEEPDTAEVVLIRQTYRTDAHGFVITDDPSVIDGLPKLQVKASTPSGGDQAWGVHVYLVYAPVAADSHTITPTPYEHPEPFPPIPGRAADDPTAVAEDTDSSDIEASDERDSRGTGNGGRDGEERLGSIDPNQLDPTSRNVSPLIREWLNIAEPPENATQGAQFHYDQWGRKIGKTGDGGIITATGKPDYALPTPEETVWSMREKLDSLNHCTLEEFVVAKLNNQSVGHCRGRYNAPKRVNLSDLSGFSLKEAKAWLQSKGLDHGFFPAGPAPTQGLSYKIKETEPQAGARVNPGTKVTLKVYSEYRPTAGGVSVPRVVGLSFDQAAARLKSAGLTVKRGNDVTPAKEKMEGKVRSQVPEAGSKTSRGAPVELVVYGEYVAETKPYTSQQQVAEADCSAYPGSKAYWDSEAEVVKCGCTNGLRWNLDNTACVTELEYAREWCAKFNPGSTPFRLADGTYRCECPSGYVFDRTQKKCVKELPNGNNRRTNGGDNTDPCPCVDERGRPYRMMFGAPCEATYASRIYDCPGGRTGTTDGGGAGNQRKKVRRACDDLDGRWKDKDENVIEFTTRDGVNYAGRIVKASSNWKRFGVRSGELAYKVKRLKEDKYQGKCLIRYSDGSTKWIGITIRSPAMCNHMQFYIEGQSLYQNWYLVK